MEKFKPHPKFWAMVALIIGGYFLVFLAGQTIKANPVLGARLLTGGASCIFFSVIWSIVETSNNEQ